MSDVIDERVVSMKFDNSDFEKNVGKSMQTIEELNKTLDGLSNRKGIDIGKDIASGMDTNAIANALTPIQDRFSTLGIVGMTVVQHLTNSALSGIENVVGKIKSGIADGGKRRAENIQAAKFQLQGLGVAWEQIEADINYGVQDTAYGLDAAAKAAAQLSVSGVQVGESMKTALRGISGVAAMTNSSYEEISQIFTKAAGNSRVMAEELNQISSRGINAAAAMAKIFNSINDGTADIDNMDAHFVAAVKNVTNGARVTEGEIREMASKSKISFEMFSNAMNLSFGEHAKEANKTLTGVLSNVKSALAKIGQKFYEPIIANEGPLVNFFEVIRKKINQTKDTMTDFAKNTTDHIIRWIDLGRTLIEAIDLDNLVHQFMVLSDIIHQAFEQVFYFLDPTGDKVKSLSDKIKDLTSNFKITKEVAEDLKGIFRGLFALFDIANQLLGGALKLLFPFIDTSKGLFSTLLHGMGTIGNFLAALARWLREEEIITKVTATLISGLKVLAAVLMVPIVYLANFIAYVSRLEITHVIIEKIATAFQKLGTVLVYVGEFMASVFAKGFDAVSKGIKFIYSQITEFIQIITELHKYGQVVTEDLDAANNIIYQVYQKLISIKDAIKGFFQSLGDITGLSEAFENIKNSLHDIFVGADGSTGVLGKLKAAFVAIGEAISPVVAKIKEFVTNITPAQVKALALTGGIVALAIMFGRLISSIARTNSAIQGAAKDIGAFFKILTSNLKREKAFSITTTILSIAASLAAVAASIALLASMPIENLKQAGIVMAIIAGTMAAMVAGMAILNKFMGNIDAVPIALLALAGSMLVVATSLKMLEDIDVEGIIPKMLAVGVIAAELAIIANLLGYDSAGIGAALVLLAFSLTLKKAVEALALLADVNMENIHKYLVDILAIMGMLAVMSLAVGHIKIGSMIAFLAIVGIFKLLTPTLVELAQSVNWDNMLKTFEKYQSAILAIGAIVVAMTFVSAIAGSSGFAGFGIGLAAMSVGIIALAQAVKILSEIDNENVNKAITVVGGCLLIFAGLEALSQFTKGGEAIKFSVALMIMSAAMYSLLGIVALCGLMDLSTITKGIIAVTAFGAMIAGLIVCSKYAAGIKASTIIATTILIAVITTELVALTGLPMDNLAASMLTMVGVITAMALLFQKLSGFKINKNNLPSLIAVSGLLVALAASLIGLSRYNVTSILSSAIGFGGVMMALSFVLKTIGQMTKVNKGTLYPLLGLSAVIVSIGISLAGLALLDIKGVAVATASFGGVIFALLPIIKAVGNMSKVKDKAWSSLLGLSAVMLSLGISLSAVAKCDWKGILASAVSMGAVMFVLIPLLKTISSSSGLGNEKTFIGKIAMLGTITAMFAGIAGSLALLSNVANLESLISSTISMGIIIGEIAVMLKLIDKMNIKIGNVALMSAAVISLSGALLVMAPAVKKLEGINWESLGKAAAIIGSLMAVFTAVGVLASKTQAGAIFVAAVLAIAVALDLAAVSLIGFAKALEMIIPSLYELQKVGDINQVCDNLIDLGGAIAVLAAAGLALTLGAPGYVILAIAIAALGGAAIVVAKAIEFLSDAFAYMLETVNWAKASDEAGDFALTLTKVSGGLLALTVGLAGLAGAMLAFGISIAAVGLGAVLLGAGFELIALSINVASDGLTKLASAFELIGEAFEKFNPLEVALGLTVLSGAIFVLGLASTALIPISIFLPLLGAGLALVGVGFMALAKAADIAVEAVEKFQNIDFTKVVKGLEAVTPEIIKLAQTPGLGPAAAMLSQLAMALVGLGLAGTLLVLAVIPLAALAGDIALLKMAMEGFDLTKAAGGLAVLGAACLALGIGGAILGLGVIPLAALAGGIALLKLATSDFDFTDVALGLTALAGSILLMGLAGGVLLAGVLPIAGLAASLLAIRFASENVDYITIAGGLSALAGSFALLGLSGAILNGGIIGILGLAAALALMASPLQTISSISVDAIASSLLALALGCAAMGAAGIIMLAGAVGVLAMAVAVGLLGVAVLAAAAMIAAGMMIIQQAFDGSFVQMAVQGIEAGVNTIKGFIQGIASMIDKAIEIAKLMANFVIETVCTVLDIHSPSRKMKELGEYTGIGFLEGLGEELEKVEGVVSEAMDNGIINTIKAKLPSIENAFKSLGNTISNSFGFGNIFNEKRPNFQNEKEFQEWESKQKEFGKDSLLDKIKDGTDNLLKTFEDGIPTLDDFGESLGGVGKTAGEVEDRFSTLADTIAGQMDIFSEFTLNTDLTADKLLSNMQSQVKGVATWATEMAALGTKGVEEGLLMKLQDLGPQGYEYVHAFSQMTAEQLAQANELWSASLALPELASSMLTQGDQVGGNIVQGLANGMSYNASLAFTQAQTLGTETVTNLATAAGCHSPSVITYDTGMNIILGLVNGMRTYTAVQLYPFVRQMAQQGILATIEQILAQFKFYEMGANIVQGIANGIIDNISLAVAAAQEMAAAVEAAVHDGNLEFGSPSKRMWEYGNWLDEGFASGIKANTGKPVSAIENMTNNLLDTFIESRDKILGVINGDMDLNPVIRPTLDLSGIRKETGTINSMFEGKRTIGVEGSPAAAGTTSYNFTQNNYSPKALSRIDIYRQTKNQFSTLKGLVNG